MMHRIKIVQMRGSVVEMNSEVDGVNNDEKRSRKYRIEYLLALKGINTYLPLLQLGKIDS